MNDRIVIFALGGLDENGKNMYVVEINDDIFVFEAGLKYPDKSRPGIDFVIPNINYLKENKHRVRGYIISHGHDDQFGALPFIYKEVPAPVIATNATIMMLKRFTKDVGLSINYESVIVEPTSTHHFAHRRFVFFQTTHSAMESFGVAIDTSLGSIVYSGDFIVEYNSSNRYKLDLNSIAKIAEKDVLCLLSESSAAEKTGYTSPAHRLEPQIAPVFRETKGRIFISLYEQSTYNIEELITMCKVNKRKIAFYDESTKAYFRDFDQAGLSLIDERMVIENDDILRTRTSDLVILMLGNGKEMFEKILTLAHRENKDRKIVLGEDDTFIIACPAPATLEIIATEALDGLYTTGAKIHNITRSLVTNMHAQEEDLRMLLSILKPKYYLPIKGLYRQQIANAHLALHSDLKYTHQNILLLDNGVPVEFRETGARVKPHEIDRVTNGDVLIDGTGIGDTNRGVTDDRQRLSEDGVIIMALTVNPNDKTVVAGPDVQMRGFVYVKDSEILLKQTRVIFLNTVVELMKAGRVDIEQMAKEVNIRVERYIFRETRRRPMLIPLIRKINI